MAVSQMTTATAYIKLVIGKGGTQDPLKVQLEERRLAYFATYVR